MSTSESQVQTEASNVKELAADLVKARELAERAHAGLHRRDGQPYITHPVRVAMSLTHRPLAVRCVALLHDVLEDSTAVGSADIERALSHTIAEDVVTAVVALTKRPGEFYGAYITRVMANPIAREVKVADILDNLGQDPTASQVVKYAKALKVLCLDDDLFGKGVELTHARARMDLLEQRTRDLAETKKEVTQLRALVESREQSIKVNRDEHREFVLSATAAITQVEKERDNLKTAVAEAIREQAKLTQENQRLAATLAVTTMQLAGYKARAEGRPQDWEANAFRAMGLAEDYLKRAHAAEGRAAGGSEGTIPLPAAVQAEVRRAMGKYPNWPTDPLHALAVLGEEYGEVTKALLELTYEPHKTSKEEARKEIVQCAAMALRLLASFDRYDFKPSEQHSQSGGSEVRS
ncbi:MAG: HD domain-containing protein [Opitutaceae bacterium]|nr:HD domain-containing protein [Opitutaceae bacterium]